MKVLFVSKDLIAADLARLLKEEGCEVKLYIETKDRKTNLNNLVPKISNWKNELKWVGKNGLIVFDDVSFGKQQEILRKKGYSVFGGSELGDRLEEDREWAQEIFKQHGLKTIPTVKFAHIEKAIRFVNKHKGPWVIKQNGQLAKDINFVGQYVNNHDVISVLKNYQINFGNSLGEITLQKRIVGVEIGIGRYFNGDDWVGPIEINIEHKKLFPGDLGPATTEMGTLAWYDDNESNILFLETLAKMKPFLKKIDFRGDFDVGCIVNKQGIFPLEASPRLGTPIIHLHCEIHLSPWHKFLKAIADKKSFNLKWKRGFGIVILAALPPFPYKQKIRGLSPEGLKVFFDSDISKNDFRHIHFEGISVEDSTSGLNRCYISDYLGYVLYVTAVGNTIHQSRSKAHKILKKIYFPKMFYRNDIGLNFEMDQKKLRKWGYL